MREKIKTILIIVLLAGLGISVYFNLSKVLRGNFIENTLKCSQLYEMKKTGYWDDKIGKNGVLFNQRLDTCLTFNIYNDSPSRDYIEARVIDMSNDAMLLSYYDEGKGFYHEGEKLIVCDTAYARLGYIENGKKIEKNGCLEKIDLLSEMQQRIKDFGFNF